MPGSVSERSPTVARMLATLTREPTMERPKRPTQVALSRGSKAPMIRTRWQAGRRPGERSRLRGSAGRAAEETRVVVASSRTSSVDGQRPSPRLSPANRAAFNLDS
jgi:hypothetical protein